MHPDNLYDMAIDRQKDFEREAERRRLEKLARAGQPSVIARFQERLGGFLVKKGEQLQKRPAPQATGSLGWADK
jgi:hypothetical protein